MALDGPTDSDSSSHIPDRSLHWASLHSWNLFSNRNRFRVPPEPPPSRTHHSRSLRNCRGEERGVGGSRSSERVRKGGEGRAGSKRDASQRVREAGGRRHTEGLSVNLNPSSSSLSSSTGTMMPAVETTRRRRAQGRGSETTDMSSSGRRARPGPTIAQHQHHHHHHHHDHHHHHYHYHHHYHHLPRRLSGDLEQGTSVSPTQSSTSTFIGAEPASPSTLSNADQHRSPFYYRLSFMNNPREAAMEARDRLDERLRGAALLSHRNSSVGLPGNFLDEFGLLFDEDDDSWSDDEIWEMGVRDWLAAWGFEERWQLDFLSSSEQLSAGLSKAAIRRLHREVFVPRGLQKDKEVGDSKLDSSEQDDCSVCLEHFLPGQVLLCLPCKHRFHPDCLTPWLESHGQCPYCRAKITFEEPSEASSSRGGSGNDISQGEDDLVAWMAAVDSGLSRLNIRSP